MREKLTRQRSSYLPKYTQTNCRPGKLVKHDETTEFSCKFVPLQREVIGELGKEW